MVKISEIDNKQLLKQILKYRKILDQLLKERDNRKARGAPVKELFTPQELSQNTAAPASGNRIPHPSKAASQAHSHQSSGTGTMEISSPNLSASDVQLEIDVEEIERLKAEEDRARAERGDDEEEVRVTQLLQLSKDQLAELKKSANKK